MRSEEHTSELQSRFAISYAVFCLKKSASSNEAGYITHKVVRSLGILGFDNQARV